MCVPLSMLFLRHVAVLICRALHTLGNCYCLGVAPQQVRGKALLVTMVRL